MAGTPKTERERVMKAIDNAYLGFLIGWLICVIVYEINLESNIITTTQPIEPTITITTTNGISDTTYIYKEK